MNTTHNAGLTNNPVPTPTLTLGDWMVSAEDPNNPEYWYVLAVLEDLYYLVGVTDGLPHEYTGVDSLDYLALDGLVPVRETNINVTI